MTQLVFFSRNSAQLLITLQWRAHDVGIDAARKIYHAGAKKVLAVIVEMDAVKKMTPEDRKKADVAKQKRYLKKNREKVNARRREHYRKNNKRLNEKRREKYIKLKKQNSNN